MSDIFREVEEDVRRERFEKFFKAYGAYLIALGVVLFLGVGAYELWQAHQSKIAAEASNRYAAAQRISTPKEAAAAYAALSKDAPQGYRTVADLSQANALAASGRKDEALALYKSLAADNSVVGAVARLRAGWLMVDNTARGELTAWLAPIDAPASAWRQMADEITAYADFRAHDYAAASAKYVTLGSDPEAPDALRARARAMAALLSEGGVKDVGSVPPAALTPPGAMPAGMAAQ